MLAINYRTSYICITLNEQQPMSIATLINNGYSHRGASPNPRHEVETVPCEPNEHEHDAANYEVQRDGSLEIGTCKHCGKEFVIREIEDEESL
jgi:hypothetical protein